MAGTCRLRDLGGWVEEEGGSAGESTLERLPLDNVEGSRQGLERRQGSSGEMKSLQFHREATLGPQPHYEEIPEVLCVLLL